eukprot:SAG11_NODE_5836_length_1453_cov_0.694239_1_plen_122_part_00
MPHSCTAEDERIQQKGSERPSDGTGDRGKQKGLAHAYGPAGRSVWGSIQAWAGDRVPKCCNNNGHFAQRLHRNRHSVALEYLCARKLMILNPTWENRRHAGREGYFLADQTLLYLRRARQR